MGVSLSDRWHVFLAAALVFVLVAVPAAHAIDIAVVDYQLIFYRYEGTADAQRTLDREIKEWEQEAKALRDTVATLQSELESQRLMLSDERLREKEDQLRAKKEEYETFAESVFGVDGRAAKRNAELVRPIAEKLLGVIAEIGRERDLKIILDAGTGGVVWARDDVNITQLVLDDLSAAVQREAEETPAETPAEGEETEE
jgi:Skp family chaperone for outer membrane proteins